VARRVVAALSTIFKVHGGIQRFNRTLCRALDDLAGEMGFEGCVLSQDDSRLDYERAGAPWQRLRFVPGGGGPYRLSLRTAAACLERPDILLIGLLGMTPLGLACRPLLGRGYGFVAYGTESWREGRFSRRLAARRARLAFAISKDTAAALHRATGLAADRVRWLPPALDPSLERLAASADTAPLDEDRPELLTVSRLWAEEAQKGVDHALAAFARLAARHPQALYRIVGKGSDKPRLQALAASLGLADRVVFEEDLTDRELADRYRRCSVFVLPSGQEGFGIVFLEAMSFGRPCVGGRVGGIPEAVEDGRTGLLVDFRDAAGLEAALDRLLGDSDLRRRMGEAGRRRVLQDFTFERFRERLRQGLTEWLAST
jgi:glycosyltransferase involved in cell wall biosynthesis